MGTMAVGWFVENLQGAFLIGLSICFLWTPQELSCRLRTNSVEIEAAHLLKNHIAPFRIGIGNGGGRGEQP
jgi:hypothetical protein